MSPKKTMSDAVFRAVRGSVDGALYDAVSVAASVAVDDVVLDAVYNLVDDVVYGAGCGPVRFTLSDAVHSEVEL